MYISPCSTSQQSAPTSGTVLSITTDYYQSTGIVKDFESKGKYLYCSTVFTLQKDTPSLIYSMNITNSGISGNLAVSFKHIIEYPL